MDKDNERWIIEEARRRSAILPRGDLLPSESPDWLMPDACLGIEVTGLLRPKGENLFTGAQLGAFQDDVVEAAREHYFSQDRPDADVLVYFTNEWNQKRDIRGYAASLSDFVYKHLPVAQDSVTLTADGAVILVDGISVVRISRTGREWRAGGNARCHILDQSDVQSRIAAKEKLLPRYRAKLPGWNIWLLMATNISVLRTVVVPHQFSAWRFRFSFDRVLLMPWEGDVLDLPPK